MKTLHRYILSQYLMTLFTAAFVLTLVMTLGGVFKLTDLVARGVDWRPLSLVLALSIPQVLSYTLPVSALVSALLVFGRLSADSEMVAMRSCGISQFWVARPVWICGVLLAGACFYILNWVVPVSHFETRSITTRLRSTSLEDFLEEGRFVQGMPGVSVYVGKRTESGFEDIRVIDTRSGFRREITAQRGRILQNPAAGEISLELHDVRIDPFQEGQLGVAQCSSWIIPFSTEKRRSTYRPKTTNLSWPELVRSIRNPGAVFPEMEAGDLAVKRLTWQVELHSRIVLSLSCFTFIVLAVPLGIRSHRKETTAGIAISLALLLAFHAFMVLANALSKQPMCYPHLIVWIPTVGGVMLGIWLLQRAE